MFCRLLFVKNILAVVFVPLVSALFTVYPHPAKTIKLRQGISPQTGQLQWAIPWLHISSFLESETELNWNIVVTVFVACSNLCRSSGCCSGSFFFLATSQDLCVAALSNMNLKVIQANLNSTSFLSGSQSHGKFLAEQLLDKHFSTRVGPLYFNNYGESRVELQVAFFDRRGDLSVGEPFTSHCFW